MNNLPAKLIQQPGNGLRTGGWINPVSHVLTLNDTESPYFVQGGGEINAPGRISKLDRTITISVRNPTNQVGTAVLFGTRGTLNFLPTGAPLIVRLPDLGVTGQEPLRGEAISNGFNISGIRMFFPNTDPQTINAQKAEPLIFQYSNYTGKIEQRVYQTLNAMSPTNASNTFLDIPEIGVDINSQVEILYNVQPFTTVGFWFTVKSRINSPDFLFGKTNPVQRSEDFRPTGNPIADLYYEQKAKELIDGGFNSKVLNEVNF